jgi:hypothetical protein
MHENLFDIDSVCDEILSSYAQCVIKSFPYMLSMRMLYFSKITQKYKIKMQINRNCLWWVPMGISLKER